MRYSEHLCLRYQHAVEVIGKRWTALIIKVLIEKPLRFSELADQLAVVSDRVLSERLKELESEGIVERRVYPETPVRVEYAMTEKGRDLDQAVHEIQEWAERWIPLESVMALADDH
jgi:DNA-binding HxlR family transcriptional regulator